MGRGHFKADSKRIEDYLSECEKARSSREIADGLGITLSSVHTTLQLMEVFGTIQREKRGRYYYFLKGVYDDDQISAMLPHKKVKPAPRRRRSISPRSSKYPVRRSFLEEHLSSMREQAIPGEGPSALAMLGLTQIDVVGNDIVPAAEVVLRHLDVVTVEEGKPETPANIEHFATVEHLPRDVAKLTLVQTRHLKKRLKHLAGYDRIERLKTAFAELSALKNKSYGTVFYFAMSTNPWERVYRVKVEESILLETKEPVKRPGGKRRSKYDAIIDRFMELGHDLVEIDVEGKDPNYVKYQLRRRIEERGLEFTANSAGGFIYLEKGD